MILVRATAFLLPALVSSVMLTLTMATRNESVLYNDLSTSAAVPTCQADYAKMDQKQPKLLVNYPVLGGAHGVCTNPNNAWRLCCRLLAATYLCLPVRQL